MTEQWQELKETIIELRDNDGTGTQQEVCKFLANYMDILEKQMQEPKKGKWITHRGYNADGFGIEYSCSECNDWNDEKSNYCPNCGARMESEGK